MLVMANKKPKEGVKTENTVHVHLKGVGRMVVWCSFRQEDRQHLVNYQKLSVNSRVCQQVRTLCLMGDSHTWAAGNRGRRANGCVPAAADRRYLLKGEADTFILEFCYKPKIDSQSIDWLLYCCFLYHFLS